ncbi:MAG: gliding motility-associated C-terminal domain-containing protein [Bacteroidota bacterium]
MKKIFFILIASFAMSLTVFAGGTTYPVCPAPASLPSGCATADPFCTGSTYTFNNTTGTGDFGSLECLSTTPNPTWYYLKIATSGDITMNIQQFDTGGFGIDVDFALLGPYTSVAAACANPTTGCVEDCSYDPTFNETATISGAIVGEYYLLLLTNFSDDPGTITFSQTGGGGATDCTILSPTCQISSVSATPSNCNGSNQYNVTGQIDFVNAPGSGTLTVSSSCGGSQVFNAPFTSPLNYSLNNLTPSGGACTVTATFSADGACTNTVNYTSPAIPTVGAGNDQGVCTNASVTLNGAGATSYSWDNGVNNGVSFTPSGTQTYTVTGTNAAGCTNTDQVLVTVNPNPTVDAGTYAAVCSDGASVNLAGTPAGGTFTGTGVVGTVFNPLSGTQTITYNYSDGNGCAGSDVATITVNPLPIVDAGNNQTFCSGATTQLQGTGSGGALWSPATGLSDPAVLNPTATISSTQAYTLTVTSNGCVGTDMVTITITNPPSLTLTNDQSICVGDCSNLTVGGADFYVWEPNADITDPSLANQNVCPATTTTYTVHGYSIGGSAMNNGDFSAGNVGFTSDYVEDGTLQGGTYFVDVDGSLHHPGFSSVLDHTTGTGNYMIVNGSATPNSSVWCQTVDVQANQTYVFSTWVTTVVAASPAILQFSINGSPLGATFSAPSIVGQWDEFYQTWNSGLQTSATICIVNQNTTAGGNDFGLDDIFFSAVCEATETVTVTVNPYADATIQAQTPLCNDAATVNLSAAQTGGVWSGTGVNASTGEFDPATAGPGTHDITYTINGQCADNNTIQIVVNPLPVAQAGLDQAICLGDQVTLNGIGAPSLSWNNGGTDGVAFSPSTTMTYTLTVIDVNGCEDTDQVEVVVNSLPIVNAGLDQTICVGTGIVLAGSGAVTYSWDNGVTDNTSFNPTVGSTTYTVTGTNANGCEDTDQVTINVLSYPTAVVSSANTTGYAPLTVNFTNNSSNANSFNWDFGNGQSQAISSIASQTSTYATVGTFYVVLTASNSICTDTDTLEVIVIPYPEPFIHVPNVFTPNGDDANDVFFIETNFISELSVQIFNRWGGKMYEYDTVTGSWDGTVNNNEAEDGTYFYMYTAKGMNGEELSGHGHVTLIH